VVGSYCIWLTSTVHPLGELFLGSGGREGRSNPGAYHPPQPRANRGNPANQRICFDFVSSLGAASRVGEVSGIGAISLDGATGRTAEVARRGGRRSLRGAVPTLPAPQPASPIINSPRDVAANRGLPPAVKWSAGDGRRVVWFEITEREEFEAAARRCAVIRSKLGGKNDSQFARSATPATCRFSRCEA
jgi:hypothetical protein